MQLSGYLRLHDWPNLDLCPADTIYHDCSDVPSYMASGVYTLRPKKEQHDVKAYCDMDKDGGGWTVVIRRNSTNDQRDFYRDWDSYKSGFGNLKEEFYWGNEYMWMLTSHQDRRYQVHILLEDWDGSSRYALYQNFRIKSESDNYRLRLGAYSGDAGDSFSLNHNSSFSTYDKDNDSCSSDMDCVAEHTAAWWHACCADCQLTGKYYDGGHSESIYDGITWWNWKKSSYSMKAAVMKIKPSD